MLDTLKKRQQEYSYESAGLAPVELFGFAVDYVLQTLGIVEDEAAPHQPDKKGIRLG